MPLLLYIYWWLFSIVYIDNLGNCFDVFFHPNTHWAYRVHKIKLKLQLLIQIYSNVEHFYRKFVPVVVTINKHKRRLIRTIRNSNQLARFLNILERTTNHAWIVHSRYIYYCFMHSYVQTLFRQFMLGFGYWFWWSGYFVIAILVIVLIVGRLELRCIAANTIVHIGVEEELNSS